MDRVRTDTPTLGAISLQEAAPLGAAAPAVNRQPEQEGWAAAVVVRTNTGVMEDLAAVAVAAAVASALVDKGGLGAVAEPVLALAVGERRVVDMARPRAVEVAAALVGRSLTIKAP